MEKQEANESETPFFVKKDFFKKFSWISHNSVSGQERQGFARFLVNNPIF
ncbi:hypothetical protein N0M98_02665 [Paenibacillus doosanensis]|nr:hypothetical protein [Paenibacillus doosanensis]